MYQAEIVMGPERGHANTFHFSFSTKDGQLTGRVSVALDGRPDNRSREEKMRAARIKVEWLAHAFANASSEKRYAQNS